mmetsp:Transcript_15300/g.36246  ORF Transcript_15300/g.36246 Transcript_15300/m.36246 type:complete len:205 (+) Transcript_15300:1426-2040(+)
MPQDLDATLLAHRDRHRADLGVQVVDGQRGDRRELFGRVLGLLALLERLRLLHQRCNLILAQLLAHSRELRLLARQVFALERRVRERRHRHAVPVVDDEALDQLLEHRLALGQARAQLGQRLLEPHRLERIAVIQPLRHRPEHVRQPAREAARVELTQTELKRVERRLDGRAVEACLCQLLERRVDQRLDLRDRFLVLDPFHAH